MKEKWQEMNPQESSIGPLLERGGLTPTHWEEVLRRDRSENGIGYNLDPRTHRYIQAVIKGEIPDSGFCHRDYLGRRNWEEFRQKMDQNDRVTVPRKLGFIPLPSKTVKADNPLMVEAKEFAVHEAERSFTLDDYIFYTCDSVRRLLERPRTRHVWFSLCNDEQWYIGRDRKVERSGLHTEYELGRALEVTGSYSVWEPYYELSGDQQPFSTWLLEEKELPARKFPSEKYQDYWPDELSRQLRMIAGQDPQLIVGRLKERTPQLQNLHNSPWFGILEREI